MSSAALCQYSHTRWRERRGVLRGSCLGAYTFDHLLGCWRPGMGHGVLVIGDAMIVRLAFFVRGGKG